MYRVAVIGCGKRGNGHVLALKREPRAHVVALVDRNLEAAAALRARAELDCALFDDHREMLDRVKPDVVVLCLWTHLHLPVFRDCAQAGVRAVMMEKPLAATRGETLEFASLVAATGCQLTVCHQRRFARGNQMLRELIAQGRFGTMERMDLFAPAHMLDCGTHTIDQALSYNNEHGAKWVLAAVDGSTPVTLFDVAAESIACGKIVFENGVQGTVQFGGPDLDLWGGVRVTGSEGFFEAYWDGKLKRAVAYRDPTWAAPVVESSHEGMMVAMVGEVLDCLESGTESEVSWQKAARAAEIIFALYESARRRKRIEVPLEGVLDNPFVSMLREGAFAS